MYQYVNGTRKRIGHGAVSTSSQTTREYILSVTTARELSIVRILLPLVVSLADNEHQGRVYRPTFPAKPRLNAVLDDACLPGL